MPNKNENPRWLLKDGKISLYRGEDVEAARAHGATDPASLRSNGEPWNPVEDEDGEPQAVTAIVQAESAKQRTVERDIKREKQEEAQRQANDAAREGLAQSPDMKVQIVEPAKADKKKK